MEIQDAAQVEEAMHLEIISQACLQIFRSSYVVAIAHLGAVGSIQALAVETWQDPICQHPSKVQQTSQSASCQGQLYNMRQTKIHPPLAHLGDQV